jgi:hypothetical protein
MRPRTAGDKRGIYEVNALVHPSLQLSSQAPPTGYQAAGGIPCKFFAIAAGVII